MTAPPTWLGVGVKVRARAGGGLDEGAAHGDVVAVIELGGRLDDEVNAVLNRPLSG